MNDFIDFLACFGIDLNVRKSFDREAMKAHDAKFSPEEIELKDKDYFRQGCKTILNSERAAMKVAR